jgi:predicted nuclease of predicted toxin-antitoxin system
MKLIFDQNISHKILKLLTSDFKDSTTVKKESFIDLPDRRIWEYATLNFPD